MMLWWPARLCGAVVRRGGSDRLDPIKPGLRDANLPCHSRGRRLRCFRVNAQRGSALHDDILRTIDPAIPFLSVRVVLRARRYSGGGVQPASDCGGGSNMGGCRTLRGARCGGRGIAPAAAPLPVAVPLLGGGGLGWGLLFFFFNGNPKLAPPPLPGAGGGGGGPRSRR